MKEKVSEIINSLTNLELWSIWEDIPMYLGIAEFYDRKIKLSERQKRRLDEILSYGGNNDK
jgi:hypothetical protein